MMRSPKKALPEIKAKLYEDDVKHVEIISSRLAALGLDSSNSEVIRYALEQTAQNAGANELMNMLKNALGVEDEKSLQTQTISAVLKLLTVSEKSEQFLTDFGHVRTTVNANFAQNERIKGKLDASTSIHEQLKDSVDMLLRVLDNLNLDKKTERAELGNIQENVDRVLAECEEIKRSNIASIQKDNDYDLARRAQDINWSRVVSNKRENIVEGSWKRMGYRYSQKEMFSSHLQNFPRLNFSDLANERGFYVGFVFDYQLWSVLIGFIEISENSKRRGYIVVPISDVRWHDVNFVGISKASAIMKYQCTLYDNDGGKVGTTYGTEEGHG